MSDYEMEHAMLQPERCGLIEDRHIRSGSIVRLRRVFDDAGNSSYVTPPDGAYAESMLQQGYVPLPDGFMKLGCRHCFNCVAVRVAVGDYAPASEELRALRRNEDLTFTRHDGLPPMEHDRPGEHTSLFRRHMVARFYGGNSLKYDDDDAYLTMEKYKDYPGMESAYIDARDKDGILHGALIYHRCGASAYGTIFFHEPERLSTSLGRALMVHCIGAVRREGMTHLYLDSWTRHASPYSWKDHFTPLDGLIAGQWVRLQDKAAMRALRDATSTAYPQRRGPG